MINSNGEILCVNCGKHHALKLEGNDYLLEWYCPRCRFFNREVNVGLDKKGNEVILSKSKVT